MSEDESIWFLGLSRAVARLRGGKRESGEDGGCVELKGCGQESS